MEYLQRFGTWLIDTPFGHAALWGFFMPPAGWLVTKAWRAAWRPSLPDGVSKDMLERNKRPNVARKPLVEGSDSVKGFEAPGRTKAREEQKDRGFPDLTGQGSVRSKAVQEVLLRSRIRQGITYPVPPPSPGIEWYSPADQAPERLGVKPTEQDKKSIQGTAVQEFNEYMMSGEGSMTSEDCLGLIEHNLNETPGMEERNAAELLKKHQRDAARRGHNPESISGRPTCHGVPMLYSATKAFTWVCETDHDFEVTEAVLFS